MYDEEIDKTFTVRNGETRNAVWFNNGSTDGRLRPEPIWVTNQRQSTDHVTKRSGVMFWPGSEAPIGGMYPTYWHTYNQSYPFR